MTSNIANSVSNATTSENKLRTNVVSGGELVSLLAFLHSIIFNETHNEKRVGRVQHALQIYWPADFLGQTLCCQLSDSEADESELGDGLYVWLARPGQ